MTCQPPARPRTATRAAATLAAVALAALLLATPCRAVEYTLHPGNGVKVTVHRASDGAVLATVDNLAADGTGDPTTGTVDVPDGTEVVVVGEAFGLHYSNAAHLLLKAGQPTGADWAVVQPQPEGCFAGFVAPPSPSSPRAISFGQSLVPPSQVPDWPLSNDDLQRLSLAFLGSQVQSRRSFGYGMYVATMRPDVEQQAFVTGLFTYVFQPPFANGEDKDGNVVEAFRAEWEKSAIWRWSEVDWEFVPRTWNEQREHTECAGAFPHAVCTDVRADFSNPLGFRRRGKVTGAGTNDITAQGVSPTFRTFQGLVDATGDGPRYAYQAGSQWGFPSPLSLPTAEEMVTSVATNVFRMPDGTFARSFPALGTSDGIIPRIPVADLRKLPKGGINDLWAFAMTNESYLINPGWNPYTGYHTYTIVQAPSGIAFYVDAPGGGTDLSRARPAKVMSVADYPDLARFGPGMPKADVTWKPVLAGGQETVDSAADAFVLGHSSFIANMWWSNSWSGFPSRSSRYVFDEVQATSYLKDMAFYPLANTAADVGSLHSADFDTGSAGAFRADFTSWTADDWWFQLRRDFLVVDKSAGDGTASVLAVALATDRAFGNRALRLAIVNHPKYLGRAVAPWLEQTVFRVVPAGRYTDDAQTGIAAQNTVTVADADDPTRIWGRATYPRSDVFRLDNAASTATALLHVVNSSTAYSASAMLALSNDGYTVTEGAADNVVAPSGRPARHPESGLQVVTISPGLLEAPVDVLPLRKAGLLANGWVAGDGTVTVKASWYNNRPEPPGLYYYAWVVGSVPDDFSPVVQDATSVTWASPYIRQAGTANRQVLVYVNRASSTSGGLGNEAGAVPVTWGAPRVVDAAPSGLTQTAATVNGSVNPNGTPTRYSVAYGATPLLGHASASADAGAGTADVPVALTLTGLSRGTTYHYQLRAVNDVGTDLGEVGTFTTPGPPLPQAAAGAPPWAITGSARDVTGSSAVLRASVDPNGTETWYHFELGETPAYGHTTATVGPLAEDGAAAVTALVEHLEHQTTYHFRVVATSAHGVARGNDRTFTTPASAGHAPVVEAATPVLTSCRTTTVAGTVDPGGEPTRFHVDYGTTPDFGLATPAATLDAGASPVRAVATLAGLAPLTTYHYRLVARNAVGVAVGPVQTFTTCRAVPRRRLGR